MAEDKSTARFRRDERRGLHLRIPAAIAERLPEEGEMSFEVDEDEGAIVMRPVEISRRPVKLGKSVDA